IEVELYEKLQDAALAMEKDGSFATERPTLGHAFTFLGIRDHERCYRPNPQPYIPFIASGVTDHTRPAA
ncbi:MAG: hypothetical protein AAGJ35_02545, partial [Myxococcota bacterium]